MTTQQIVEGLRAIRDALANETNRRQQDISYENDTLEAAISALTELERYAAELRADVSWKERQINNLCKQLVGVENKECACIHTEDGDDLLAVCGSHAEWAKKLIHAAIDAELYAGKEKL